MDTTRIGSDLRSSQGDVIIFVESFIAEHESNIQFEIGKVTRIGKGLTVYSQNDFSVSFGFDLPCYSFSNTCKEKPDLSLNDESHKIFFNASAFKQEKNLEKKSILEYITDRTSTTDFTNKLDSLVEQTKLNEIFRGCIKNFS